MIPKESASEQASTSEYQWWEHAAAGRPSSHTHAHAGTGTALQSIGELEEVRTEVLPSPAASLWSDLIPSNHFSGLKRRASTGNSTDTPKSARSGISIKAFFQSTFLVGSTPEENLLPIQQQEAEEVKKKESKWAIVRRHVRSGHFLVHRSRSDDEDNPNHPNYTNSHHTSNPNNSQNPDKQSPQSSPRRQQRLLQAYQQIHRRIHFSPAQCLWLIAFYVAMSVLVFSFLFRKWTIIDSCYFAVVTFSTNGYGDLVPTTDLERMFTCLYVLSGVSFVAVALGMLGSNLIEAHDQTVAQAKKLNQYQAMSLFQPTTTINAKTTIRTGDASTPMNIVQTYQLLAHDEAPWYKNRGILSNVAVALVICLLGYLIGEDQGWDLKTTIYYGIITASTVGFGDFAPESQYSRLLSCLFIPLAAVSMARCIQLVAKSIINRRRYHSIHKFCNNKELSLRDLEVMDRNDDGIVAWSDFLEFMLLAMKRVDQNMLDELRKQFDRLDVDKSGTLDKQDLIELAKRELQSPRRKLQLALYKKNLMTKCLNSNPEKIGGLTVALEINPPNLPGTHYIVDNNNSQ